MSLNLPYFPLIVIVVFPILKDEIIKKTTLIIKN